MDRVRQRAQEAAEDVTGGEAPEEFGEFELNAEDFRSVRERGESARTRIEQREASLKNAAEVLNRSFPESDEPGRLVNVVSPVVLPGRQSLFWRLLPIGMLLVFGLLFVVSLLAALGDSSTAGGIALAVFGPHLWLVLAFFAAFLWWRQSVVMVPDGCKALVTRFGRLERVAEAGRTLLFNPWKQVSYLVNTVREYPYNAPIREAPTSGRVNASVDLFLQFRIEDPAEFIFTLGGVKGFSDKLENAISEMTRAMIYEQRAEDIYDLVGGNTQKFVDSLNEQFQPAVRFTNANITHAEPSSREYRMDLASPEMVRVAKEAYTYQYELRLRKEQDEGELNRELAELRRTLSEIQAEIATYQAQIDTAKERETNRANARARQRMVEAESEANANASLLEAQALDIRAVSSAGAPEILEYRFERDLLEKLEEVADRLPQVVHLGDGGEAIDFLNLARRMIGTGEGPLYRDEDMQAIRGRIEETKQRIEERKEEIEELRAIEGSEDGEQEEQEGESDEGERVEEIRQSVTDEQLQERMQQIGEDEEDGE
jgi:regulator of protease activity HflC (stomatin/prohibitin superfamily)